MGGGQEVFKLQDTARSTFLRCAQLLFARVSCDSFSRLIFLRNRLVATLPCAIYVCFIACVCTVMRTRKIYCYLSSIFLSCDGMCRDRAYV